MMAAGGRAESLSPDRKRAVFIRDYRTALMVFVLTVLNAVIGMKQEGKAEASTAALKKMMKVNAKVRRDGERAEISAERRSDRVHSPGGDQPPGGFRVRDGLKPFLSA